MQKQENVLYCTIQSIQVVSVHSSFSRQICDPLWGALVSLAREQPQGSSRWKEKVNEYENENEMKIKMKIIEKVRQKTAVLIN